MNPRHQHWRPYGWGWAPAELRPSPGQEPDDAWLWASGARLHSPVHEEVPTAGYPAGQVLAERRAGRQQPRKGLDRGNRWAPAEAGGSGRPGEGRPRAAGLRLASAPRRPPHRAPRRRLWAAPAPGRPLAPAPAALSRTCDEFARRSRPQRLRGGRRPSPLSPWRAPRPSRAIAVRRRTAPRPAAASRLRSSPQPRWGCGGWWRWRRGGVPPPRRGPPALARPTPPGPSTGLSWACCPAAAPPPAVRSGAGRGAVRRSAGAGRPGPGGGPALLAAAGRGYRWDEPSLCLPGAGAEAEAVQPDPPSCGVLLPAPLWPVSESFVHRLPSSRVPDYYFYLLLLVIFSVCLPLNFTNKSPSLLNSALPFQGGHVRD